MESVHEKDKVKGVTGRGRGLFRGSSLGVLVEVKKEGFDITPYDSDGDYYYYWAAMEF